jgi:toluene monooxygenase system ferredoxin subunit
MTETRLCALSELCKGEMRAFTVKQQEIIVLWPQGGEPKAYDAQCPHQQISLADGDFDGSILVCAAHQWSFDGVTGACIDPGDCVLRGYRLLIAGDEVAIDFDRSA